MPKTLVPLIFVFFCFFGCTDDVSVKVRFDNPGNLKAGDVVAQDGAPVGEVRSVESQDGASVISLAIRRNFAGSLTENSNFYIADDPKIPDSKRVEIEQTQPGGKLLESDTVVQGSARNERSLFPFSAIIKEFSGALRDFSGQVEQFRQEFERLPNSQEGKQLKEEWLRLLDEVKRAQNTGENTIKKDLLPKLENELKGIQKQLEQMQKTAKPEKNGKET